MFSFADEYQSVRLASRSKRPQPRIRVRPSGVKAIDRHREVARRTHGSRQVTLDQSRTVPLWNATAKTRSSGAKANIGPPRAIGQGPSSPTGAFSHHFKGLRSRESCSQTGCARFIIAGTVTPSCGVGTVPSGSIFGHGTATSRRLTKMDWSPRSRTSNR
jgi:hypothetical protein